MIRQTISFYKNFCMITRKKTRMAGVALMCAAAWTAVSCEMNATVDADHEPVLQIDAVFYSDEAMPVIRVRQSFHTARKGGKFLVEKEAWRYPELISNSSETESLFRLQRNLRDITSQTQK